jgi:hypothetical protein
MSLAERVKTGRKRGREERTVWKPGDKVETNAFGNGRTFYIGTVQRQVKKGVFSVYFLEDKEAYPIPATKLRLPTSTAIGVWERMERDFSARVIQKQYRRWQVMS